MEIFIEKENITKKINLEKPKKISEILKQLNIKTNTIIIVKNKKICLENETAKNEDKIKLLSVVSGG